MSDSPTTRKPPSEKPIVKEQQGYYEVNERFEIIGGVRYDFLSSPKFVHQKMLTNFHLAFHRACCNDGEIILAPMDVHFDEDNIVQPDVIYIARANLGIIRDGYVFGVPDLIVEILSNSTGRRDKTIKKTLYEQFGVKEYWLADPVYRTLDQFVLVERTYRLVATLTEEEEAVSATVPCLSVDLKDIFPADERQ